MKFELYTAIDKRDNKQTYWLLLQEGTVITVALFDIKTVPSRIKRNSLHPDHIVWVHGFTWAYHADKQTAKLIDSWEWAE